MNKRKVVVIGWDGAPWPVLQEYMGSDSLPSLKRLVLGGAAGDLESTVPFFSGPAWVSIVTGVNPGKHNICHFCRTKGYDMQSNNSSFRRSRPIWDIIGQAGMPVAVVNIPMTYPPDKVNGVMVSGMDTPSEKNHFTFPPGLRDELIASGYQITWGSRNFKAGEKSEEEFVAKVLEMATKRGDLVLSLLQNLDPRFLVVNFAAPDRIQHFFWHMIGIEGADRVREIYQKLDCILADILRSVDESTTLLLVSDHGFGPRYKTIAMGRWLEHEGLLKLRWRVPKYSLRKLGATIEKIGGERSLYWARKWIPQLDTKLETANIDAWSLDWSKTKVWFPPTAGGLRMNLKGREPRGIVDQGAEYEHLRDYLIGKLESLTDPDNGTNVIEKVHRREEIYSGPYVADAPDLIIQPARGYTVAKTGNRILMGHSAKRPQTGEHTPIGILIAHGRDIKKGASIGEACVYDIAPTVLHLLGLPVPIYMDGRVLGEIFEVGSEAAESKVAYYEEVDSERERIKATVATLRIRGKT